MKSRTIAAFRGLFALLYYALCVGFVVTVAFSVTYGAFRSTTQEDDAAPSSIQPDDADGQQCFADLRMLLTGLHEEAGDAFEAYLDTKNLDRWNAFSADWRGRLDALSRRCHLTTSPAMKPMKVYAKDVERIHRAYDTSLRSYAERLIRSAPRLEKNHKILSGEAE